VSPVESGLYDRSAPVPATPPSPPPSDILSQAALDALTLNADAAYRRLVVRGDGNADAKRLLSNLAPAQLFRAAPRDADEAAAVLSALWLWHDWLDESHTISQGIGSATGSFWHAIMHRREGDFSNSKYWYAKCRNHLALGEIAKAAPGGRFDPFAFVDAAERAEDRGGADESAIALQRLEWQTLFNATVRAAAGG
jgi:hypothetical protein